jgi:hypothetical protein
MKEFAGTTGLILNEPLLQEKGRKEGPVFPCPGGMLNPFLWMRRWWAKDRIFLI